MEHQRGLVNAYLMADGGCPGVPEKVQGAQLVLRSMGPETGRVIATLGPGGTSSEAAARNLAASLGVADGANAVALYPSYEEACAALSSGGAGRLLVANAYHHISEFYMSRSLALERAFVFDTPLYGLASRRDAPLPLLCDVVTHPAPRALIQQLIPPGYRVSSVGHALSTIGRRALLIKDLNGEPLPFERGYPLRRLISGSTDIRASRA